MVIIEIPASVSKELISIKYVKDGCNCEVDLRCSEQKSGNFLIDERTYLSACESQEAKKILDQYEFEKFNKITKDQVDLKTIE